MGFINQFPYSDFHELNIDWILKQIKEDEAQIEYLKEEFAKIEVVTEEHIKEMIQYAISTNNIELRAEMVALKETITNEYKTYVDGKIAQLNLQIQQLRVYVDNQDVYYDTLSKDYANTALNNAKTYTDEKILNYTMMINPITGVYEDVRNVVNDIVSYFHTGDSLTAIEYDTLDLTAQDYDDYELSAYDYDFNGKNLLH